MKMYYYIATIIHNSKREDMIVSAFNIKNAKEKVYDIVIKSPVWNYSKGDFYIECKRIRLLEGGEYEKLYQRRNHR